MKVNRAENIIKKTPELETREESPSVERKMRLEGENCAKTLLPNYHLIFWTNVEMLTHNMYNVCYKTELW